MMRSLFAALLILTAACPAAAQSRAEVTDEIDRFMLALFDQIQPRSIAENKEYCGVVGFDGDGVLRATTPRQGTADSCDSDWPNGWEEVVATYHTHGAFLDDADSEVPSVNDLEADIAEKVDGYVATPGGRVWLNVFEERLTFQLCGRGCVTADPKARPCQAMIPAVEYTLAQLKARVANDTGEC